MKFGVPTFSYSGFEAFAANYNERDFISINLGDYMQSLAIRNIYRTAGVEARDLIEIDRDGIANYRGETAIMIMNGCYYCSSFPLPDEIIPIFIGLCVDESVVVSHTRYFKKHEPIGCRDTETCALFLRHGVRAYVTGCLTMTFSPRSTQPPEQKVLVVYGAYAGSFPVEALKCAPRELLEAAEFISHRKIVHHHPLTERDMREAEGYARSLLDYYRDNASLVVTSLHHVAAPCIALGIPTIICRKHADARFSYLQKFLPVHVAPDFDDIRWEPHSVDLREVRRDLIDKAVMAIKLATRRQRSSLLRWTGTA